MDNNLKRHKLVLRFVECRAKIQENVAHVKDERIV